MRGRSRGGSGGGSNGGGGGGGNNKGGNTLNRSYESNGPDVKIRGTAGTIADKYVQLSRDALTAGDPVAAENYMQHAEHYYRLLAAAQAQFQPHQTVVRADADDFLDPDDDDDGEGDMQPNAQPNTTGNGQQHNAAPQNAGAPQRPNNNTNNGNGGRWNGGQNGANGQGAGGQARDGEPRRFDRNERRPDNRPDNRFEQRDNRPDRSQEPRFQESRSHEPRSQEPRLHEPRAERSIPERAPRVEAGDDQPFVGELPSFITGEAAAPVVEARKPRPAPAPRPAPVADEPSARVEPASFGDGADEAVGGEPRAPRGRRRRYGRVGREEDGASEDGAAPAPSDVSSD